MNTNSITTQKFIAAAEQEYAAGNLVKWNLIADWCESQPNAEAANREIQKIWPTFCY